jgi:FRG domain
MTGIERRYPKSLPDYMEHVQVLQQRAKHAIWFRGCGTDKHKLVPSLYRHPRAKTQSMLEDLERQLMSRFRQRSIPYHSRDLRDDWEALFFMQHYGVPTRLLDWTENSLTALHFSLMTASRKSKGPAVVWVLDPVSWNQTALKHMSYSGGPLTVGDEGLKGYAPRSTGSAMSNYPVALFGAHNSPRIVAQQGAFTIFGASRRGMEDLVNTGEFPSSTLSCIVVQAGRISTMRSALLNQGVTESVVFPDLEGLARETKRHFGFEG